MTRLNIFGASGHGKVIADIARLNGYDEIYFYDDNTKIKECDSYPVIGGQSDLNTAIGHIFIAVGNASIRRGLMKKYRNRNYPVLIHPKAIVADNVKIGHGTVVMAGAVINTAATIGEGCIVNTGSSVDHDCVIGDYCHIAVGAHLCGTVNTGNDVWIGAGATVSNNVNICGGSTIGAGAVVIKNIDESGTYVGVPAIKLPVNRGGYFSAK